MTCHCIYMCFKNNLVRCNKYSIIRFFFRGMDGGELAQLPPPPSILQLTKWSKMLWRGKQGHCLHMHGVLVECTISLRVSKYRTLQFIECWPDDLSVQFLSHKIITNIFLGSMPPNTLHRACYPCCTWPPFIIIVAVPRKLIVLLLRKLHYECPQVHIVWD